MSQLIIQNYLNELDRIRRFSGVNSEQVIREAFKDALKAYAKGKNLIFIPELEYETGMKNKVYPDGSILYELRVPHGFWEAKDTADDLDVEIAKKLRRGYPQSNIIFENSEIAVLIQDREEVARCAMTDVEELGRLLDRFFAWERPEISEFRRAVQQFKADLPAVLDALRSKIDAAYSKNAAFQSAAATFLDQARDSINPSISEADVREMLIQHILTEEIFAHVFNEGDFHRENNIAKSLYDLEAKFFTGAVKKDTLRALEPYYAAIRANAANITSHHEKQTFLKVIYENFYKVYNPKAADRLGVVYTPNEIVRFMIEGADWLCREHFGKGLIDEGVEILDPATGTGTFVCEIMEHFRGQPQKLARKYKEELHANEVAILPYYVANLNIEATYYAITGQYAEFPNLCFVDTLDNTAALSVRNGQQIDLFGGMSEENVARIRRQNERKISVIIGNPPYNANQRNENDNNKNREYPEIDSRIKGSYIRASTAQKTKVYDMYARFFRWASDRVADDGVLAFVTNRSFIESRTFDGFRKSVAEEFADIYIVDLGGDVRANSKLSGTKHNVFGIQTGVAISFLVKRRRSQGCRVRYVRRPEFDTAEEKIAWLASNQAASLSFERIEPDTKGNWLGQTKNDWDHLIPLADRSTKISSRIGQETALFKSFSLGISTNRDEWAYDNSISNLQMKIEFFVDMYNNEVDRWSKSPKDQSINDFVNREIKWTAELEQSAVRGDKIRYLEDNIYRSLYRPFVKRFTYFAKPITHRAYQNREYFPFSGSNNKIISISGGKRSVYALIASSYLTNTDMFAPDIGQGFPRYRYNAAGEQIDNITNWGFGRFVARYGPEPKKRAITKDAIFHYVYGVLHDPLYRKTYEQNLKRDFPRIPFQKDFWGWADWGARLMKLHIAYEEMDPWPLKRIDVSDERTRAAGMSPRTILKSDHANGTIRIDSETQISDIPNEAFAYRLGNRSALDWILDQYREKTPRDPTIRAKFNKYRFADYKEQVIDLIARVTRVSVETVAIIHEMQHLSDLAGKSSMGTVEHSREAAFQPQ